MILLASILIAGFYMAWSIGANDVANAMGTSVGSRALTLKQAVLIAAVLEFCGAFFFGSYVSETVQSGIIDSAVFAGNGKLFVYGMLSALIATGLWLQIASYNGWPVSTTHSIVGALVGFGAIVGGINAIYWKNVFFIVTSWIFSPFLGGALAFLLFTTLRKEIFYKANPALAAKRLTPWLVFAVFSLLTLSLIYKGLHNLPVSFSFLTALLISFAVGSVTAFFCFFLVRSLPVTAQPELVHNEYMASASRGLRKAHKHLQRVQTTATGEVQARLTNLLHEVQDLSQLVKPKDDLDYIHSEYSEVEKIFSYLQIVTACMMAFAHGANDVANAIGPISAAIHVLKTGVLTTPGDVPSWILALGGIGIVVGLATWGWRVIETIGKKITELTPSRGFAAEFGAAVTILFASRLGLPISTTHTLVGAVIGVGMARGIEALNLNTMRDIVISWFVTIPAGAILTVVIFYMIQVFSP